MEQRPQRPASGGQHGDEGHDGLEQRPDDRFAGRIRAAGKHRDHHHQRHG
jgi:hypothetical protein